MFFGINKEFGERKRGEKGAELANPKCRFERFYFVKGSGNGACVEGCTATRPTSRHVIFVPNKV